MKRRLLAVLLTAGLVLAMTACGGKSEESTSGSASEDTSAADAGGEADAGETDAADDAGGADAKDISCLLYTSRCV